MKPPKKFFSKASFAFNFRSRGRKHSLGVLEKSFSIIDYKAYNYYINNSKLANRGDVSNYVEHGKIISMFYKIAGEKITEAKGGLFLDGLGYFGILQEMSKKLVFDRRTGNLAMNPKTDNIIYNIAYVPITKDNAFKAWVFDYSFVRGIKKALCIELKSGKKYSFNASLFFNKLRKGGNDF